MNECMAGKEYIVECNGRVAGRAESLEEALRLANSCGGDVSILECRRVFYASREALRAISIAPPAPEKPREGERESGEGKGVAVVFDQMFKGFAEILEREIGEPGIVFHEILGRGIPGPVKLGERLYQQPARDDYDVLKLLERLAGENRLVVFFTGDKKLARQARAVGNVEVVFLPPGEVTGKEMALKAMAEKIRELSKRKNPG